MFFLAANFTSKLENKCEFFFYLFVAKQCFLQGQKSYTDLSKIIWLRGIIRIFKVLRYNVISNSKSFSNSKDANRNFTNNKRICKKNKCF